MESPFPQPLLQSPALSVPPCAHAVGKDVVDLNALVREAAAIAQPNWRTSEISGPARLFMRLHDPAEIEGCSGPLLAGLVGIFVHCVGRIWAGGELFVETHREGRHQKLEFSGSCRSDTDSRIVFETFFPTVSPDASTPIAHPLVREIVERHAGVIALETNPQGHPVITLRFPLSTQSGFLRVVSERADEARKPRILVVENG